VQHRGAAREKTKCRYDEDFARPGKRQPARKLRDCQVHGEVGKRAPGNLIIALQRFRHRKRRKNVHAREMIGVIKERQRLAKENRQRDEKRKDDEKHRKRRAVQPQRSG
jgi:hypothetical protein